MGNSGFFHLIPDATLLGISTSFRSSIWRVRHRPEIVRETNGHHMSIQLIEKSGICTGDIIDLSTCRKPPEYVAVIQAKRALIF
jgi:hypothetical protein